MKMPFRRVFASSCAVWFALLPAGAARAQEFPLTTREEALASLKDHQAEWKQNAADPNRLLFFDAPELQKLRQALKAGTVSPRLDALRGLIRRAQDIAKTPPTPYLSPEEVMAKSKMTPLDARQQLWEREVGDEVMLLSFAATLSGDEAVRRRLHDTVVAACRYPTWGLHPPNGDLSSGHLCCGIATAWSQNPDLWSAEDRSLIQQTIRERAGALLAGVYGGAFWARSYQDNQNEVSVAGLRQAVVFEKFPRLAAVQARLRCHRQR